MFRQVFAKSTPVFVAGASAVGGAIGGMVSDYCIPYYASTDSQSERVTLKFRSVESIMKHSYISH